MSTKLQIITNFSVSLSYFPNYHKYFYKNDQSSSRKRWSTGKYSGPCSLIASSDHDFHIDAMYKMNDLNQLTNRHMVGHTGKNSAF